MNDITSILHQFKKGLLSAEEAAEYERLSSKVQSQIKKILE